MSNKDGGPAFPQVPSDDVYSYVGLSLRDYFAAKTLSGVISNISEMTPEARADIGKMARDCYLMADAMLKAREAK